MAYAEFSNKPVRVQNKGKRFLTTRASILASITVDGAYFAAYPYMRAKAACMSSDSSFLKPSEKNDRNLHLGKRKDTPCQTPQQSDVCFSLSEEGKLTFNLQLKRVNDAKSE